MRLWVLTCGIALVCLWPSTTFAQNNSEAQLELARTHMEQGRDFFAQARFTEAAQEFLAAYEVQPFSAFLFNAGVAYERHGEPARAAELFRSYVERDPEATDAADVRARIERLRAQALAAAAAFQHANPDGTTPPPDGTTPPPDGTTPPPDGTTPPPDGATPTNDSPASFKSLLYIETIPVDAHVTILHEGNEVNNAPTVDPGDYTVRVEHPDYNTKEVTIRVRPNELLRYVCDLSRAETIGFMSVQANVEGARLFIDDHSGASNQIPYRTPLPIGPHHIWIERSGYQPVEQDVTIEVARQLEIRQTMERLNTGRIRVIGNVRGAIIYVDDARIGVVPWEGDLASGRHRVRVEADGMKDWDEDVEIARGQLTPVRLRMRPAMSRGGAWVSATFSLLSIGGGVVLGQLVRNLQEELDAEAAAGTLASNDGRLDRGKWMSIGADAAFGVGAALAVLSLYYFIRDPLPDSEGTILEPRDWALLPSVDAHGGGAVLRGSF